MSKFAEKSNAFQCYILSGKARNMSPWYYANCF